MPNANDITPIDSRPLDADDDLLATECSKLDVEEELAWAEFGLSADLEEWPDY